MCRAAARHGVLSFNTLTSGSAAGAPMRFRLAQAVIRRRGIWTVGIPIDFAIALDKNVGVLNKATCNHFKLRGRKFTQPCESVTTVTAVGDGLCFLLLTEKLS